MANFHRHNNGIGWFEITWLELVEYSHNGLPICDECLKDLVGMSNIVLIPLLNEAYCPDCGKAVLGRMKNYAEDRAIAHRREQFWLDYFGIKGDRPAATGTASPKVSVASSLSRETPIVNMARGCRNG